MIEYLFSYGTLQRDDVQLNLFGRHLSGTGDVLKGYEITDIELSDQTFLSKGEQKHQRTLTRTNNDGDIITGTVFEVSFEELAAADQYEPDGYERVEIGLASGKRAWVYLAT